MNCPPKARISPKANNNQAVFDRKEYFINYGIVQKDANILKKGYTITRTPF
jgi:hypothetical protein